METIHLKTVDPVSQDLLRVAAKKGIQLNWDRYEKLQPQDGFLRLGLSCPYGCLQGPCRIDPFERGPEKGACGLSRDGMVAAFLLRLTLQGALEISEGSRPALNPQVTAIAARTAGKLGGDVAAEQDLYRSAQMLARPSASPEQMIQQALRLGVFAMLHLNPVHASANRLPCRVGYGLLADDRPLVAVAGNPSKKWLEKLLQIASDRLGIVSLGDWIPLKHNYLPCVCSSGEAELAISSEKISLLVAGPKTDPGLLDICHSMNLPVVPIQDDTDPEDVIRHADSHQSARTRASFAPDALWVGEGTVLCDTEAVREWVHSAGDRKFAGIGGSDTLSLPFGWIPVEVAKALKSSDIQVAAWEDAALWMMKEGLASADQSLPALVLDPNLGPVGLVAALVEAGKLENLRGLCFAGACRNRDLALALGLAATGNRVCVTTPIPLWGSDTVRGLLTERLGDCEGSFSCYDHPAGAEEVLDWFMQ